MVDQQVAPVAVILLAAGKASRMTESGGHKLLATFDGVPLVRRLATAALSSRANSVIVVTGHRSTDIEAALSGLAVEIAYNADYSSGMASSLIAGLASSNAAMSAGTLILLADMPAISTGHLDDLIEAFHRAQGTAIIRASCGGKKGNPVILPRALYAGIRNLKGDIGARHLIESSGLPVIDIEMGEGALVDVDTPEAVIAAGGELERRE